MKKKNNVNTNGNRGILLDLGCKDRKQANWYGVDSRQYPGVDRVLPLEVFPYPFEDESCLTIKAAHLIEHFRPTSFFPWMDECWRILKPLGQIAISVPYAGSPAYLQDPTHQLGLTERSWQYLDPDCPLYRQYEPRPWKIEPGFPVWQTNGNLEVVLRKRPIVSLETTLAHRACSLGAMQKVNELQELIRLLRPIPLRTVVEIGTAKGGVWFALCQLAPEHAYLASIDLPGGQFGGGYTEEDQVRLASYARGKQKVLFIRNDSHLAITKKALEKFLQGREIDLLFVDGDHTYKGVKQDHAMYSPLVRRGGLIVFHDICFHPTVPQCEVEKFWNEVKVGQQVKEIIDPKDTAWGGIGVLWHKGGPAK